MLKIKENVDLKELEKFGFKKHKHDKKDVVVSKWIMDRDYSDDFNCKGYLTSYPIIELYETLDNRLAIHICVSCYNLAYTIAMDLLFDLIKAGLVEKV